MSPKYKLFDISSYVYAKDDDENEDKYRFHWEARVGFCVQGKDSEAEWSFLKHKDDNPDNALPSFTLYSRESKPDLEDWSTRIDKGSKKFEAKLGILKTLESKEDDDTASLTVMYDVRLLIVQIRMPVDGKTRMFEYAFDLWKGQHHEDEERKETYIGQRNYRLFEAMKIQKEESLMCDLYEVTPGPEDVSMSAMKQFSDQELRSSFACRYFIKESDSATESEVDDALHISPP